jgi:outer membrane protein assembly factor BamB
MVGGDPSHTGVAEGPPAPYRKVWSTRISDPGTVAGPVVQGGSVVVVAAEAVVALSAETGEIQWETAREPGPTGPAAIDGERVVFAEGTGARAVVTSVNLNDGAESWHFDTKSPVVGGVTVEGGLAYVGSRDGKVRALDVESGDEEWSFDASGRAETPPAVAQNLVLVIAEGFKTGRATAHALDVRTGKEEWSFSPEGVAIGASAAAVGENLAVFGLGDLKVHALELESGRERWSGPSRAPFSARMVPAFGDDVFIADRLGHLYRFDATTGEEIWVFRVPGSFLTGAPALIASTVIAGDTSGQVSAIDLDSGHLVWKEDISARPVPGISVAGDRIFVSSADGSVLGLEHDPRGSLLDEASPTQLFVGRAVLNFAGAFVFLLIVLVTLFRWVGRRRGVRFANEIATEVDG